MQSTSGQPDTTPAEQSTPVRRTSNIEVIIPAFNEEANLPHALASVIDWADAVHVVDSESTDRTRDIAKEAGANVVVRPWLGYARQKNWALDNLPLRADWVFILDADESVTPELRDEMMQIAAGDPAAVEQAGFYVNRLTYFLGKPIRHCGYFPSYNLRLFKRGKAHYEDREVHEHMVVDGPTRRLRHMMLHEDRRGLEHFIAKHNRYSTLEARELHRERAQHGKADAGPLEIGIATRRWLKRNILPRLPLSGIFRFIYMYILRLGFLDGVAGLRFCLLLATYDLFITLKLAEIRATKATVEADRAPKPATVGLAVPEGRATVTAGDGSAIVTPPANGAAQAAAQHSAAQKTAPRPAIAVGPPHTVPLPSANGPAPATARTPAHAGKPAEGEAPTPEPRRPQADDLARQLDPHRFPPGKWPAVGSVPVSILVPVKNEERNIVECLRRVEWATELVVVDSQSTDRTIELSQAMGADVYQFHYNRQTGWPKKKNWAIEEVPWKNEWVMILDADEYMTPELAEEIRQVVTGQWKPTGEAKPGCGDGFWVNRRFMFMTRWLKGCGYYPSWNVRLFKHAVGRYERIGTLGDTGSGDNEVHEHVVLSTGEAGYLRHEFLHYAYPDLSAWIEKHNRYTTWEAHAMEAKDEGAVKPRFFGGPIERRRWLKSYARRLPMRPTLRFMYSYFVQKGWQDGYPGLVMCRLLAWYEFMSIAKFRERQLHRTSAAQLEDARKEGRA